MLLCDIGNTHANFYDNGSMFTLNIGELIRYESKRPIYYINVNPEIKKQIKNKKNFINIEKYLTIDTSYLGLGADRKATCMAVDTGVIVDAGSAITLDVVSENLHLGGFILPGINAYLECYKNISSVLDVSFMSNLEMFYLPSNTASAVNYGIINSIILMIENHCKDKKIYFTGGDGMFLSKFFPHSIYSKTLVFDGMKKALAKAKEANYLPFA